MQAKRGLGRDGFRCGDGGDDGDEAPALSAILKLYDAVDLGVEGVVGAASDIEAGLVRCAALANQDRPAGDCFAAEALDAEPLGV